MNLKDELKAITGVEHKLWQEAKKLLEIAEEEFQAKVQKAIRCSTNVVASKSKEFKKQIDDIMRQTQDRIRAIEKERDKEIGEVHLAKKAVTDEAETMLLNTKSNAQAEYDAKKANVDIWLSVELAPWQAKHRALDEKLTKNSAHRNNQVTPKEVLIIPPTDAKGVLEVAEKLGAKIPDELKVAVKGDVGGNEHLPD